MYISSQARIDNLFTLYEKRAGFMSYLIPGSLLDGYILTAPGCKTTIIKEVYLNCYSSGYSVRKYNTIPAKYQKVIDLIESGAPNETVYKAFCA